MTKYKYSRLDIDDRIYKLLNSIEIGLERKQIIHTLAEIREDLQTKKEQGEKVHCKVCKGTGFKYCGTPCSACKGEGYDPTPTVKEIEPVNPILRDMKRDFDRFMVDADDFINQLNKGK